MAARDTFNWLVQQYWPNPDPETKRFLDDQRDFLMKLRSEDERTRYLDELVSSMPEAKKKKRVL